MSESRPPVSKSDTAPRPFQVLPVPGRLLLIRVFHLPNIEAVNQMFGEVRVAMQKLGDRIVVCADYRQVALFSPEVSDEVGRQMAATNPRVERSGILTARAQSIQHLQSNRLVKSAGLVGRRVFSDSDAMCAFLNELLNPAEQTRLQSFLAEHPA